jgi:hypothetical protein
VTTRLVMVSGSGWGAGKSTLAAGLAGALTERGAHVRHLTEDDLLAMEAFAAFERQLGPADPDTNPADQTLLAAIRALLAEHADAPDEPSVLDQPSVLLTDAILPGFFWLLGRYSPERVRKYADELATLLQPYNPLLVYLRGDARALLDRAAADRGTDWLARVPGWVTRWRVPHYPGGPLTTLDDVTRLWQWLDTLTVQLLSDWPVESLVLDAMRPAQANVDNALGRIKRRPGIGAVS